MNNANKFVTRRAKACAIAVSVLGLLWLPGCANKPIVDLQGADPIAYQRDLAECERYAEEVKVARKAGGGAVAGAAVGAVIGAIVGGNTGDYAGVGGTHGAVQGTYHGVRERRQVVRNCLRHRGYAVLN